LWKNDRGLLPAKLVGIQTASRDHYFTVRALEGFNLPPLKAFIDQQDQYALQGARFQQYVRAQPASDATLHKALTFMPEVLPGSRVAVDTTLRFNDPALIEWTPPLPVESGRGTVPTAAPQRYRGKVALVTTTVNME